MDSSNEDGGGDQEMKTNGCRKCLRDCPVSDLRQHFDCDHIMCVPCLDFTSQHSPVSDTSIEKFDCMCCNKTVDRKDFVEYKPFDKDPATMKMEEDAQPMESSNLSMIEEGVEESLLTEDGNQDLDNVDADDYLDAEESIIDDTLLQDADGVITFNMTLQERLQELSDVFDSFSNGGLSLHNFWALYVETYVEPIGWHALLKPRQDVHDQNCSMTSCHEIEQVEVVQINCSTLDARVKRENDDNVFEVPLLELYPLAKQENSFLAMKLTAKCIDNYRFFVNHLYLPWDPEDARHWCEKHLESRIQLYHDLQSGSLSESLSKEITDLITEAKRNQVQIDKLEDQLEFTDCDGEVDEKIVLQLLPIHTRQDEINLRLQKLENPIWRNVLGTLKQAKKRSCVRIPEKVILIATNFTCSDLVSDLQMMRNQVGDDEKIRMVHTLQEALDSCEPNSTIFIKPGVHAISGLGNLEEGGSIVGLTSPVTDSVCEIITRDAGDVWLVVNTESLITLENIKITVSPMYTPPLTMDDNDSLFPDKQASCYLALLVQRGSLNLKNVILEGFAAESGVGCDEMETNGIKIIGGNGILSMTNCRVLRFVTGIVVREQTTFNMKESEVENCVVGIEVNSEAQVQLSQVNIMKCLKFGLKVYSNVETTIIGSADLLQTLSNFKSEDISFQDCVAAGVCICRPVRLSCGIPEPPILQTEEIKAE